ncbi:hypothetical protein Drose_11580 [Dactylosporangium roseum]|uniref:Uncharacterized protein n=1 Tax=Dactylosporangium roseum TaxID=47989 RepID=A0ABY5Z9T4_9ACTN|nr:hypothetical protein [Dactylosporangium roseum]UWZ38801.1 hypothetical protein Drose_11580 [Dactylosporangium roseum]
MIRSRSLLALAGLALASLALASGAAGCGDAPDATKARMTAPSVAPVSASAYAARPTYQDLTAEQVTGCRCSGLMVVYPVTGLLLFTG